MIGEQSGVERDSGAARLPSRLTGGGTRSIGWERPRRRCLLAEVGAQAEIRQLPGRNSVFLLRGVDLSQYEGLFAMLVRIGS
jgi:hypothetical protein